VDNPAPVIGIDNFDFQGGRDNDNNKDAFELLDRLIMEAKDLEVILIIGTHNKHIVDDPILKEMKSVKPCLASIEPNEESPAGVTPYKHLSNQRREGAYNIINNLRMDTGRKQWLLERIFFRKGKCVL